jgi:hypothetical protein
MSAIAYFVLAAAPLIAPRLHAQSKCGKLQDIAPGHTVVDVRPAVVKLVSSDGPQVVQKLKNGVSLVANVKAGEITAYTLRDGRGNDVPVLISKRLLTQELARKPQDEIKEGTVRAAEQRAAWARLVKDSDCLFNPSGKGCWIVIADADGDSATILYTDCPKGI